MNNPQMMMQLLRSGGNPRAMLARMAQQDPRVNSFMQMVQGKDGAQLKTMAENIARERGIDINSVINSLGK